MKETGQTILLPAPPVDTIFNLRSKRQTYILWQKRDFSRHAGHKQARDTSADGKAAAIPALKTASPGVLRSQLRKKGNPMIPVVSFSRKAVKLAGSLAVLLLFVIFCSFTAAAETTGDSGAEIGDIYSELYGESGADSLADSLPQEARELLESLGVEPGRPDSFSNISETGALARFFSMFSGYFSGPQSMPSTRRARAS